MYLLKSVILVLVSLVLCASTQNQINNTIDAIGFPESEENQGLKNKDNRTPVFIPSMCPANELYYPGDQKYDWICDCRPSYIYHPGSDACWPAFQKGPCGDSEYLVLKGKSDIPNCEKNPCVEEGFVPWNGKCEKLGTVGPCNFNFPTAAFLGVNSTTLVVSCIRITVPTRFNELLTVPTVLCPPGCKRSVHGKCMPE